MKNTIFKLTEYVYYFSLLVLLILYLFPGSLMHCSSDPEHHHSRMVINMNFMLEGVESERKLYRR